MARVDPIGQVIRAARTGHGWTQADLGQRAGCDQATVSRVELGRTRDPGTLRALADALGLPTERVGLADLPAAAADRLAAVDERPRIVDLSAIAALADVLAARRRAEDTLGPGPLLRPVLADLDVLRNLDRHAARHAVRAGLGQLAAEHAQFLGWMATDLGQRGQAARWYSRAASWSDQPAMTTSVLSMSSHLALYRGQPADALALAESGWSDWAPPGVLGLLAQQQARAHATLGDRAAAERLLAAAEELSARAAERPDDEPPWTYFQNAGRLLLQRGVAYTMLGLGRPAVDLIRGCLDRLPDSMRRDRGWMLARLARAHAVAGDLHDAVQAATHAATIANGTESAHTWRELRAARRDLDRWAGDPAVRALDNMLSRDRT